MSICSIHGCRATHVARVCLFSRHTKLSAKHIGHLCPSCSAPSSEDRTLTPILPPTTLRALVFTMVCYLSAVRASSPLCCPNSLHQCSRSRPQISNATPNPKDCSIGPCLGVTAVPQAGGQCYSKCRPSDHHRHGGRVPRWVCPTRGQQEGGRALPVGAGPAGCPLVSHVGWVAQHCRPAHLHPPPPPTTC